MNTLLIGQGHVFHSRQQGAKNQFRYPTFYLQFACAAENKLNVLLKKNYRGWLSVSAADYLNGEDGPLDQKVKSFLSEFCNYEAEEVWLHTLPKMFGYVFNPVSFWLCRKNGKLEAVLVEVHNTFGERHFYWVRPDGGMKVAEWHRAEKVFHVSPFFPIEGYYQFRFQLEDKKSKVDINYHAADGQLRLATWVQGELNPLCGTHLWSLLAKYGWITPMVVLRIHYQALRLWLKKSKFYSKPEPPRKKVSL